MQATWRLVGIQVDVVQPFAVLVREPVGSDHHRFLRKFEERRDEDFRSESGEIGIAQTKGRIGTGNYAVESERRMVAGREGLIASALQDAIEHAGADGGGESDRALVGVKIGCRVGSEPKIEVIVIRLIPIAGTGRGAEELADEEPELGGREWLRAIWRNLYRSGFRSNPVQGARHVQRRVRQGRE